MIVNKFDKCIKNNKKRKYKKSESQEKKLLLSRILKNIKNYYKKLITTNKFSTNIKI